MMVAGREKMPLARDDITVQVLGDEAMLHDADTDTIHVLNQSAYAVWQLCNGENTIEDMFDRLSVQYPDAGEGLLEDIQGVLQDFKQKLLLV